MVIVLGALSAFGPLSLDMYLPGLPMLADDLHTSTSVAQLSLTACLLGLSLGQVVAGPLSDVRGRRLPLWRDWSSMPPPHFCVRLLPPSGS